MVGEAPFSLIDDDAVRTRSARLVTALGMTLSKKASCSAKSCLAVVTSEGWI